MAKAEFKRGTEEFMMFADFYNLFKQFWYPEDTDEYWEELMEECDKFYRKYNSVYAKHLALAIAEALEEISKKGKETW